MDQVQSVLSISSSPSAFIFTMFALLVSKCWNHRDVKLLKDCTACLSGSRQNHFTGLRKKLYYHAFQLSEIPYFSSKAYFHRITLYDRNNSLQFFLTSVFQFGSTPPPAQMLVFPNFWNFGESLNFGGSNWPKKKKSTGKKQTQPNPGAGLASMAVQFKPCCRRHWLAPGYACCREISPCSTQILAGMASSCSVV